MSTDRWRITFLDGTTELTPEDVDKLRIDPNGALLYAYSTRTYGADYLVTTYTLREVRKWERV